MREGEGTNDCGRDSWELRVDVGRDGELEELPLFLRVQRLASSREERRIKDEP